MNRVNQILLRSLTFTVICSQMGAAVEVKDVNQLALTTKRAVVFKDGYCLVVKEAVGTTNAHGDVFTQDVPDAAVLGSFWAIPETGTLKAMVSGWNDVTEKKEVQLDAAKTIEIVEANLGANCNVRIGDDTKMSGKLLKVLGAKDGRSRPAPAALQELLSSSVRPRSGAAATIHEPGSDKFLLRTVDGDVMVDASIVKLLTIENMKTKVSRQLTRNDRTKQMRFRFAEKNAKVKLAILYFRPGVRWIPSYRIDLADAKARHNKSKTEGTGTVRLSLQGEIVNEAEDFEDVPMDIVVGVPNFRFRGVASPLVLEAVLRNTLAQAAPQLTNQRSSNTMFNNYMSNGAIGSANGRVESATEVPDMPDELTTNSGNDLFVYSLPKTTLRKGDRASIPILSADVPYRDVYTWDVTVKHSESIAKTADSPMTVTENTVWRQIELSNNSKIPWTTGAAMIVDGFQPLAQELLTYTPSGTKCRIPVTIAVDVRGQVQDREVERKLDALRFAHNSYAKVRGQILASLKNHKPTPVQINVSLRFGGKGDRISDAGTLNTKHFRTDDWVNYRGDPAVNNSTRATWTATIPPGQVYSPRVDYHFFTRH